MHQRQNETSAELAQILNRESVQVRLWEEEGTWLAECTDIPGCMTQGNSRSEALANILDAIAVCLEVIAEDAGVTPPVDQHQPEILTVPLGTLLPAR